MRFLAAATVCLIAAAPASAAVPLVNATIEPGQISLGESAQLTITSNGNGLDGISLPQVSGLQFRVVGQSHRIEIINGATLATTSIIVRVTPEAIGIFTIPGITPKSQPLVLRVTPDNGGPNGALHGMPNGAPAGGWGSAAHPPAAVGGSTTSEGIRLTADGAAFLRFNLPKRDVYVGESIPVEIELGMRAGFVTSLNGLPSLSGSEFTLNNLSRQPERVEKLIDGKPFTVLTWHSILAPVKPGTFTLSVQSPLTVRVRTRPQRDSMIDDMLGDPFLQNFFGATVPKEITVSSTPTDLKVLALPEQGRPANFSGAVGSFKITSDVSASAAATGDPLTLRMHVVGSGNFDRVDTAMLEHLDEWKTYPPKSTFTASDTLGYKGEKIFEQPLIASRPGPQTLPSLAFSYFDPTTQRYETAHSAPLNVTISPSLADSTLTAPPVPAASAKNAAPPAKPQPKGLRADHPVADGFQNSLVPLYMRRGFDIASSIIAALIAGGWLALRRGATASGFRLARRRGRSQAAQQTIKQLEAAAGAGDSALFFSTARGAVRQKLAARWQIPPEDITAADVQARLGNEDEDLLQLFVLADETNYAGQSAAGTDFERWLRVVREHLSAEVAA